MADEIDSLEQGERARKWMQQNGSAIIIGVLAAVAILMGYEAWKNRRVNHQGKAGETYVQLSAAVTEKRKEDVASLSNAVAADYTDTAYAALARLDQAHSAVTDSNLAQAIAAAQQAVDTARTDVLADTARLRLARLQLADAKPVLAQQTLDAIKSSGFAAQVKELRGDALLKQGKSDDARKAYEDALAGLDAGSPLRNGLQMKIDDLSTGS